MPFSLGLKLIGSTVGRVTMPSLPPDVTDATTSSELVSIPNKLMMARFEPRSSIFGRDCSINCSTSFLFSFLHRFKPTTLQQ